MDRLFLDANILFSAAYLERAGVAVLWSLEHAVLTSSHFAVEEARRNLRTDDQQARLQRLLDSVHVVQTGVIPADVRESIKLPEKDWPIVAGAIAAEATHLITGDLPHFGPHFHRRIAGILVLPPAEYIRQTHDTS